MKINLRELFTDAILPTETVEKRDLTFENVDNNSATNELYKARKKYKKAVNDENLPIGVENFRGQVLKNQLDTWYEDLNYGKYDFDKRLVKLKIDADLRRVNNTEFELLDFAADAVEGFLEQYNVDRKAHPNSILNDITVIKGYERPKLYQEHVQSVYERFFNEVLSPIRNTNKIKSFGDYLNLFYSWFIDTDSFITEAGFYESGEYNLHNTGLAFEFFTINSDEDKSKVLNDPRYPVLNYVAKINGLRVDPNYPGRLILDVKSRSFIFNYAKKYFPSNDPNDIPKLIFEKYFETVNLEKSSEDLIVETLQAIAVTYNRFTVKYNSYVEFEAQADLTQDFKRKFSSNVINRQTTTKETFFNVDKNGFSTINKFSVENYIKLRAKEKSTTLTNEEIDYLVFKILNYIDINNRLLFDKKITETENENTKSQAINLLEAFLADKKNPIGNKKQFVFFWRKSSDL